MISSRSLDREAKFMNTSAAKTRSTVIPALRYRDAKAAIGCLCDVFGFEKHAVYEGEDGMVMHAELAFGNGMIMLGSVTDTPSARTSRQPDEIGNRETQSPYLVVADADAVYERAKMAKFEIVLDIKDEDMADAASPAAIPRVISGRRHIRSVEGDRRRRLISCLAAC